ncbi:ACT domain-containing protein [Anaeromassilibacillus sp. An200]|uniref:ACT domain-containing protein n=1 Tax=Candidatus Caccousia stercoris TaxID=2840723 RepID=A0A9D1FRE5_9FIRM|nr:ACT domain-containing protein [Anaeromassilibacillus sp. An200]OUP13790.1 acetolactate synthase [Anaeromassilibacillus sp. An200]HIS78598.1 ACT domain-containing protein [Candidatus Caccousia stercoris]
MQIQQLSIFVENKSGRLAEITEILGTAGVDIRAISVADTSDFGILRLIVDKPKEAVEALRAANLTVSLTSVIAVGIDDKPGEFAKAMRVLADGEIGVEYMYAFISRDKGKAYVILRVLESDKAVECLKASGISLLDAEEIYGM